MSPPLERRSGRPGRRASDRVRAAGPWVLTVLGELRLARGSHEVALPTGRPAGLVSVLVALGGTAPAERVVEVLWPGVAPAAGAARLRTVLHRLRKAAPGLVVRDGGLVRLGPDVVVDALEFEARADVDGRIEPPTDDETIERVRATLERYTGDVVFPLPYEPWAVEYRERLRRRVGELLTVLATHAAGAGRVEVAVAYLDRASTCEPGDEQHLLLAAELLEGAGLVGRAQSYRDRAQLVLDAFDGS